MSLVFFKETNLKQFNKRFKVTFPWQQSKFLTSAFDSEDSEINNLVKLKMTTCYELHGKSLQNCYYCEIIFTNTEMHMSMFFKLQMIS